MYRVLLERVAEKDLSRLASEIHDRVIAAIRTLATTPRPPGCRKLAGSKNDWRIRVGGYRVLEEIANHAEKHPEWPRVILDELDSIKAAIKTQHGTPLKYVIWAGVGGTTEDKAMYLACGLLKRGPKQYILDSADPAKLKAILADMKRRAGSLEEALKSTLVVGMAMGMTTYEPVINLEKLAALYDAVVFRAFLGFKNRFPAARHDGDYAFGVGAVGGGAFRRFQHAKPAAGSRADVEEAAAGAESGDNRIHRARDGRKFRAHGLSHFPVLGVDHAQHVESRERVNPG